MKAYKAHLAHQDEYGPEPHGMDNQNRNLTYTAHLLPPRPTCTLSSPPVRQAIFSSFAELQEFFACLCQEQLLHLARSLHTLLQEAREHKKLLQVLNLQRISPFYEFTHPIKS